MKKFIVFIFSITLSIISIAQNESISLKNNINWISKGKIYSISKNEILFKPSSSEDDNIIFRNENGKTTAYKSKRQENGLFPVKRNEINIETSNQFKKYLLNTESNFNLSEDKIDYTQYKLGKFRKLQLTARWMSIFGATVATFGSISALNNSTANSNPAVFTIGGAALSGLGFIIDLASFSKLKFDKSFKSYDEKTKTYNFE